MLGTFQMNLLKVMAQADPHRQLAYAVQRTTDEVNRLVATGDMPRINEGLEDGECQACWEPGKDLFSYYNVWDYTRY